jgi:hypothetical protein
MSGAGWLRKNDVQSEDVSVEAKYTDKKSFSLKVDDLLLAEKYALLDDRDLVFAIEFSTAGRTFAVISWEDYLGLKATSNLIGGERHGNAPENTGS